MQVAFDIHTTSDLSDQAVDIEDLAGDLADQAVRYQRSGG
jgi:hypothetical protein